MKTRLTPDDKDRVWRATHTSWLHYGWYEGQWYIYPLDPRTSPHCTNRHLASQQHDGVITRSSGFEEVP